MIGVSLTYFATLVAKTQGSAFVGGAKMGHQKW